MAATSAGSYKGFRGSRPFDSCLSKAKGGYFICFSLERKSKGFLVLLPDISVTAYKMCFLITEG